MLNATILTSGPSVLFHSGYLKIRKSVIFNNIEVFIPVFKNAIDVKNDTANFIEIQQKGKKSHG